VILMVGLAAVISVTMMSILAITLKFICSLCSGWLVGWGFTALLTQNRSYRACKFVGILNFTVNYRYMYLYAYIYIYKYTYIHLYTYNYVSIG